MTDFRCTKCGRLLAKVDGGKVQIKCHYCRTMNEVKQLDGGPSYMWYSSRTLHFGEPSHWWVLMDSPIIKATLDADKIVIHTGEGVFHLQHYDDEDKVMMIQVREPLKATD